MEALSSLNRKFIWGILLWVALVAVIALVSDSGQFVAAFKGFKPTLVPAILSLTFMNYLLRYVKWQFFLRQVDIDIPHRDSLRIFLSGLAMAVSPGKIGEIVKSLLIKELNGAPVSRTAPVIFVERLSDGFGMIILSMSGIAMFRYGWQVLLVVGLAMVLLIAAVKTPLIYQTVLGIGSRIGLVSKFAGHLETIILSAGRLLTLPTFGVALVLTVISWFFECIAFYLVFHGLGFAVSIWAAAFTLSFASIVGAASMLPGGVGAVEGSIIGLLVKVVGVPMGTAAAAAILIRFSTLWFGVAVGILALGSNKKLIKLRRVEP